MDFRIGRVDHREGLVPLAAAAAVRRVRIRDTRGGRFTAVLRMDPLLRNWPAAAKKLHEWGYAAGEDVSAASIEAALC